MKKLFTLLAFLPGVAHAGGGLSDLTGPVYAEGPLGGLYLSPSFAGHEAFVAILIGVGITFLLLAWLLWSSREN